LRAILRFPVDGRNNFQTVFPADEAAYHLMDKRNGYWGEERYYEAL
jgi:hypothetical protein